MSFSDETLMAYADDELDAQTRADLEAAMVSDPEIARKVEGYRRLNDRLQPAFDAILQEPVPDRLIAAARTAPIERRGGNVIPIRRTRGRAGLPQWAVIAASLLVGLFVGQFALRPRDSGPLDIKNGQIVAGGELQQALSRRLAGEEAHDPPVQLGISFREKGGGYCRTFLLRKTSPLLGVACRDREAWRVQVLAQSEARQAAARPTDLPPPPCPVR